MADDITLDKLWDEIHYVRGKVDELPCVKHGEDIVAMLGKVEVIESGLNEHKEQHQAKLPKARLWTAIGAGIIAILLGAYNLLKDWIKR